MVIARFEQSPLAASVVEVGFAVVDVVVDDVATVEVVVDFMVEVVVEFDDFEFPHAANVVAANRSKPMERPFRRTASSLC